MSLVSLVFCLNIFIFVSITSSSSDPVEHKFRPFLWQPDKIPTWILARENISAEQASENPDRTWGSIVEWLFGGNRPPAPTVVPTAGGGDTDSGGDSGQVSAEGGTTGGTFQTCNCKCGAANSRLKIVGGQETRVKQYPWMAMLSYDNRFYCGGALINGFFVLTAAHCVHGFTVRRISIRLLEHDRNTLTETRVLNRGVRTATVHPRYNQNTFNNDIALLRLDQEVPFNMEMKPVCLPERGKRFTGEEGTVAGWGKMGENAAVSSVLRQVKVPILSNSKCTSFYGTSQITDNMLCAGYKEGGKDSCQGDSGGPLIIRNSSAYHLVGVVSWGEGCARPNNPGVYARVNRYLSWIAAHTDGTCFCSPS